MGDKVNYSAMDDRDIELAVLREKYGRSILDNDKEISRKWDNHEFNYCSSWADAGPIIAENGIGIMPFKKSPAKAWPTSIGLLSNMNVEHENPLRAAMIVFLMMQEGV